VTALEKPADSEFFQATVTQDQKEQVFKSKKAVIASGAQNKKIIPPLAANIPGHILQLHACEYRNPAALPQGSVLVIGSAQSGVQICEDLLEAGRKVYLSSSMVARMPRRYRGKDLIEWMILTGIMDIETDKVPDPQMLTARQPLVSGVGVRGRTVSLQGLARKGAVILGKMDNADAQGARFKSNAPEHIKFADDFSQNLKNMVDEYISKTQIDSELPQKDPEDLPDKEVASVSSATSLNFKKDHITSIIWATGFTGDYNYLKFPVFNNDGSIKHLNGVTDIKGLYVLGFPWLRKRKSGIVLGIDEDARFISEKLKEAI